ncbi:DUF7553 family protein [Salinigranum halophilum]|uniref:DUF7553 family protein n=1 Tax=Salinigranum halophilum TaxID=2565931 RepID=UPI0010A89E28|nr:hypothetical protein [Salinigranum halophilum]
MNKHFRDAWYYLGRATDHLRIGLAEELAPVEAAARERFGWEETDDESDEPPTRLDRVKTEFRRVDTEPVRKARERIGQYRGRPPAE